MHALPLPDLWSIVRRLLADIVGIFADPEKLRRIAIVPDGMRDAILSLLHPAELIARRLLLAMAHELGAPPEPRAHKRPFQRILTRRPRFNLINPPPMDRARKHGAPSPRPETLGPLADRIEALQRVLENPAPYAKRLARRLNTHYRPSALVARLLRERRRDSPFAPQIEAADAASWAAAEHFSNCDTS